MWRISLQKRNSSRHTVTRVPTRTNSWISFWPAGPSRSRTRGRWSHSHVGLIMSSSGFLWNWQSLQLRLARQLSIDIRFSSVVIHETSCTWNISVVPFQRRWSLATRVCDLKFTHRARYLLKITFLLVSYDWFIAPSHTQNEVRVRLSVCGIECLKLWTIPHEILTLVWL